MTKSIKAKSKTERKPLTQERLKELFHYDLNTGIFTRTKNHGKSRIGARAGCRSVRDYRQLKVDYHKYYEHRLVWLYIYGHWPAAELDHINGDTSDNCLCNLREATRAENQRNSKIPRTNKSGYKGVFFDKRRGIYRSGIKIDGHYKYLGGFNNAIDAHRAYCDAAIIHFGNFARFN